MATLSPKRLLMPSLGGGVFPRVRRPWQERGSEHPDAAPDFYARDLAGLAEGMRRELAGLLGLAEQRLELVSVERPKGLAMRAVYRDGATGHDYEVSAERHSVNFGRVGR
ncbi:MAG TPA: hypothetical protein VGV40_04675 [Solirubrobacteraceae bacterium]|nr:hypothetical protein [Solirubrobacteraceae bacterium]